MPLLKRRRAMPPRVQRADFERVVLQAEPDKTTCVLFDSGGEEDDFTAAALLRAQQAHRNKLRVFVAAASEFESYFAEMEAGRRAFDSFSFERRPVVGVYRGGKLLTTFHPRRVFYIPKLQARETQTQFDIFLKKFVYYDPSRVRNQTNLEVVEKEEQEKRDEKEG